MDAQPGCRPDETAAVGVLTQPFERAGVRRLMAFGHPGHELALFGVLQRYRPQVVVITDGGSAARVQESRAGLTSIGMLERTIYLGYSEAAFYTALLDADVALFADVVRQLRSLIVDQRPEQMFCDAVEFYNPVHDITLPLVRAAVDQWPVDIYEVPLVYQKDEPEETYEIQRVPSPLAAHRIVHALTPPEVDRKAAALNEIYRSLHDQAGPVFLSLSREHLGREEMAAAVPPALSPAATGRALRYEWRARRLLDQGAIQRAIGFADHYQPIAERLARLRVD